MGAVLNLTGQRFGRLVAVEALGPNRFGKIMWKFSCDCGGSAVATGSLVKRGTTASCGCLGNETRGENARKNVAAISAAKTKHGHATAKTPEYHVWKTMRQRCMNPRDRDYASYGGRGITVCERWDDFAAFYADMGTRPSHRHSIDRINNDGSYSPDNCRWATDRQQASNRRPRRDRRGDLVHVSP